MKTLIRSNNRSPLRCGFFTLAIALAWFALTPTTKALLPAPTPDGGYPGGNTAEGTNALHDVTTGINNTAVGLNALTNDTTGGYNVAVGSGALQSNTTGDFNMAIGAEALRDNNANFNLAIGFRVGFMNTTGNHLTGVGAAALRNNLTGDSNTAIGADALRENTTGEQNTAIGDLALTSLNPGDDNTAVGFSALSAAGTNSAENVAVGSQALANLSAAGADFNTALGTQALLNQTSGDHNIAIGEQAGDTITTGSSNIVIGAHDGSGLTTASNSIAIGTDAPGNQSSRTFVGNLTNSQVQSFNGTTVKYVTSEVATGRLGVTAVVSSRRYKYDIKPMDKVSEGILALKPVTFHLKKEVDTNGFLGFGLIAEEVEAVNPDLVYHDEDGSPESVRYDEVWACLLNEFIKEHRKVEAQQASIAELKSTVALQQKGMEVLTAQLKEQAAQIQRVSAQLDVNKPAPRTVANK